jgi:tetratricopeptide (TPR) repeat protein
MSAKRKRARLPRLQPRPPSSSRPAPASRSGRWRIAAVLLIMLIAALAFLVFSRGAPPPVVVVDTTGFDPVIAADIAAARLAAQEAPRSADARGRLGMVLLAHEVRAEAGECFSQAMAMAPREPRWPYFLAMSQMVDNPMAAVPNLELAVRLFPQREFVPRLKLADTLLSLGRLEEAEAHYRHVWERNSNSAHAALGLGKVANLRDQLSEAADFLAMSAQSPSTRRAAHRLLLTINQRLGRQLEAETIARALAELPEDELMSDPFLDQVAQLETGEKAWTDLAEEYIRIGRPAEAVRLLTHTIETYPNSDRALFLLGRARLRLGDGPGAEADLMRAVELAPDSVEAQMQLGITRLTQGRAREAQPCFRAAIRTMPNLAEAWFNLGLSLGNEADRGECVAAFREAIRLKPNLVDAYLGLAVVLRANGENAAAAQVLRQALELDPEEPLRQRLLEQLQLAGSHRNS